MMIEDIKHKEAIESFDKLLTIMDTLREKCPWDKKQTLLSLRHLTIEETHELSDAIISNSPQDIKKEVGDLLLHIVFYAKIAQEDKLFDIKDVIDSLCEKLIRRHPHIYGTTQAEKADDVVKNWEEIKLKEGQKSTLEGVPSSLEPLIKAYRIQDKARGVGFDWDNIDQVWQKVEEELSELRQEIKKQNEDPKTNNHDKIEDEFGDVLFALINYSRFIDVNPDLALERTNKKFISRFQFLEKEANGMGKRLKDMTLEEMDKIWDKAKQIERKK